MKKVINFTIGFVVSSIALVLNLDLALAHGGHDHDAAQTMNAPKGGVVKSLEKTNVEVVSKGNNLSINLYDKEMKPKATSGFTVTAAAELPRSKKRDEIKLVVKEFSYEAVYDAKGVHRYTFIVSIKDPATGHDDKLKYTIEPKR